MQELDLAYAPAKEPILQLAQPPHEGSRAPTHDLHTYRHLMDLEAVLKSGVLFAGGVPVGVLEAVQAACKRASTKYGHYMQLLASCPLDYTYEGVIFMYCTRPQAMLNHFIRAVHPSLTTEAAAIAVIAPHVPLLCLFGCSCLFVLGLVPFWVLRESFFFLLLCGVCLSF